MHTSAAAPQLTPSSRPKRPDPLRAWGLSRKMAFAISETGPSRSTAISGSMPSSTISSSSSA